MTRSERLAAWFASDAAGWLKTTLDEVRARTAETYDEESFEERFAVVERLELPGHDDVICSTVPRIEDAADLVSRLYDQASDSSWFPVAVVDLYTGEELTIKLTVALVRP